LGELAQWNPGAVERRTSMVLTTGILKTTGLLTTDEVGPLQLNRGYFPPRVLPGTFRVIGDHWSF
jgi:hypothetical protein